MSRLPAVRSLGLLSVSALFAACSNAGTSALPARDAGVQADAVGTDDATSPGSDATTSGSDASGMEGSTATPSDAGVSACGADGGSAASTKGVLCTYSYSGYNSSASVDATSTVQWACGSTRTVTGNGIPDHPTGTFPNPNCPNTIAAQSVSGSLTLAPVNTGTATNLGIGPTGYAINGVVFDPGTAGTCSVDAGTECSLIGDTGSWNIEALGQSSFNFGIDSNNAHVQPTGTYHYHGMPEGILTNLGKGAVPTLVGFALDGFPVYARYGYSSALDDTSSVKVMKGSYQLKASPDAGRPPTSTYPMGAFTQDYEYVAGSGDLDTCNGRFDVTPEFPCGIYHYYITDTYPFIGRCVMGTPATAGGGGQTAPDAGMCSDASACSAGNVCCPSGLGCAGQCVPDCRQNGDSCNGGLTCNTSNGVCTP